MMSPFLAKTPRLSPSKIKVLAAAADLSQEGEKILSSQVRARTGISQQLLNRYLRSMADIGLLQLNHPGPGLPLEIMVTPRGAETLEALSRPRSTAKPPPHSAGLEARAVRRNGIAAEPQPPLAAPVLNAPFPQKTESDLVHSPAPEETEMPPSPELSRQTVPSVDRKEALRKLGVFAKVLSQSLKPHVSGMDQRKLTRLVAQTAADLLGLPLPGGDQRQSPWSDGGSGTGARAAPPELDPSDTVFEERLAITAHPQYQGMAWHERTHHLGSVWDRALRRHLGRLNSRFKDFSPRWERDDWNDFNHIRRQADFEGAVYEDWVRAQVERLKSGKPQELTPNRFYGQAAAEAFQRFLLGKTPQKSGILDPPPYSQGSFDLQNPEHVAYAEKSLEVLAAEAQRMHPGDPQGVVLVLVQAMEKGEIPLAALELRPQWRNQVLDAVRPVTEPETIAAASAKKEDKPKFVI